MTKGMDTATRVAKVMLVASSIVFAAAVGGLLAVVRGLRRAPEGYEDEGGFHLLRERARGSAVKHSARQTRPVHSKFLKQAGQGLISLS